MSVRALGLVAAFACAAIVAQAAVFRHLAVDGVVPNLVLLLVVASAIARGPQFGAGFGFAAGLLLDVAPPADHVAGRWALALVLVGYLAGRVRADAKASAVTAVTVTGAASFVATSIFALSAAVVGDSAIPAEQMIRVIMISVLWDLAIAPLALPLLIRAFEGLQPVRVLG